MNCVCAFEKAVARPLGAAKLRLNFCSTPRFDVCQALRHSVRSLFPPLRLYSAFVRFRVGFFLRATLLVERIARRKGCTMSCDHKNPVVGIIMGSESDMPNMEPCMKQLDEFGVPYEVKVASAHRKPAEVHEWASTAHERGIKVIIAAAGKAAHLGGVVAAYTPDPVIAVPMKTSDLGGLDSLLSMVQMPSGVPVATVAINGAKNAAILAVQMLGTGCDGARQKIIDMKKAMAEA